MPPQVVVTYMCACLYLTVMEVVVLKHRRIHVIQVYIRDIHQLLYSAHMFMHRRTRHMHVHVGVVSEALQVSHYMCHDLKCNCNIKLNVLFQCNYVQ